MTRAGRDAASVLLAGAVRLLPAGRREWGSAMQAELAGLETGRDRRRFALGCVRAVAAQPAVLRGITYPLLLAGALVAVLEWTSAIAYAPLHWGLVTLVVVLVTVSHLGRRSGVLGPVADGWTARLVRAGGHLVVGTIAVGVIESMPSHHNPYEQARYGVPIFTVVLASTLIAFLAVTAGRSAATGRVLAIGAGTGLAAAALWLAIVLVTPPIPASVTGTLGLIAIGMIIAASANARHPAGTERGTLAALCAGTIAALLIFVLVALLSSYGPPSLIPDLVPAAITPADDVANSRIEIVDPYIAVVFVGWLLALALGVTSIATRRQTSTRLDPVAATVR